MRVELRQDLDAVVARMVRPTVDRLTAAVAREARDRAPAVKIWLTAEDERVRPAHAKADGQTIPANLRFKLRNQSYIRGGGRGSRTSGRIVLSGNTFDLAREPRDEDLPADQRYRCRCIAVEVPGVIARNIVTSPAAIEGTSVRGQVSVRFNRIVESEHGTSKDHPARFLGGALAAVASRTRSRAR